MSKYCEKCGAEIPDSAMFCNQCGAAQATQDPAKESPSQKSKKKPAAIIGAIAAAAVVIGCLVAFVLVPYIEKVQAERELEAQRQAVMAEIQRVEDMKTELSPAELGAYHGRKRFSGKK